MINGAQDFAEYANKIMNGVSCLYPGRKRNPGRASRYQNATQNSKNIKSYKVLRTYNEDDVCKTEFYELVDETPVSHSTVPQRGRPGSLWAQSASIKL